MNFYQFINTIRYLRDSFFFFLKGVSPRCAIWGCKNTCGSAAKNVRTLKGLYEIDPLFVDFKIENLQVCNVHYDKDRRRHHQLPSDCTSLVEQTCLACCQNVKTTRLQPCIQHTLWIKYWDVDQQCNIMLLFL